MDAQFAVVALVVAGYGLVAARLDRLSVGPALFFLVIGAALSADVLGVISLAPGAEPIKLLAEITLTLLLFADASAIRATALRRDAATVARLLIVGLLLTIALGTIAAIALFPGISLGLALLISASLAPTDAALGQPVVTNPVVPARVRRVLNVESGLNDGIATPFVFLAVALATSGVAAGEGWLVAALEDTTVGATVGIVIGLVGGFLLVLADRNRWTSSTSRQLFALALALACYLAASGVGANGFIAAFVGGFAFGAATRQREEGALQFTEAQGSLLAIGVWVSVGLTVAGEVLGTLWDLTAIVYALVSLTVVRMLPVAIALLGERFQPLTVLFIGWFGPRGLASIVFLVIALDGLHEAGVDSGPVPDAIIWTVLLSVVLHGLSAGPLAARYGRRMASLGPDAPELAGATEPHHHRTSWARPRPSQDDAAGVAAPER